MDIILNTGNGKTDFSWIVDSIKKNDVHHKAHEEHEEKQQLLNSKQ